MNRLLPASIVGLVAIAAAGCVPASLSGPQPTGFTTLASFACPGGAMTIEGHDGVNISVYIANTQTPMAGGPIYYAGGGQSVRFSGDYHAVLWTKADGTTQNCAFSGLG